MRVRLLGGFEAEADGRPLPELPTEKSRALLAFLALESGSAHPRERLGSLLWPELPSAAAAANLRKTLYRLQGSLESVVPGLFAKVLDSRRHEIACRSDTVDTDVAEFEGLLATWRAHEHRSTETCDVCLATLEAAASRYRGELLDRLRVIDSPEFDEWLLHRRNRLHEGAKACLTALAEAYDRRGEAQLALATSRRLLEIDPYLEAAHRKVITLLAAAGEVTAAVAHFSAWRQHLRSELGVEPETLTLELVEAVRAGEGPGRTTSPVFGLPVQTGPLLGRERELLEAEELLLEEDSRLVTLMGPGGTGKTRMAAALGARLAAKGEFVDGIYFVPLAQVGSREELWESLARALGLTWTGDEVPGRVVAFLRSRRCALVLDNFEQLVHEADAVNQILDAASQVKVVATSRVALDLTFERRFPLRGLGYPSREDASDPHLFSSIKLFVDSARRARPDFELSAEDASHVAAVCRAVEGSPLAIELAAAWTRLLSCDEIARRLGAGVDLLTSSKRNLPKRHRSMAATFEHSWELLAAPARRLLAALSVFKGPFSLDAVLEVTGGGVVELSTLLDHSLLTRHDAGAYGLHEMVRRFAAERLAADAALSEAVRDRHARYYLRAVKHKASLLHGPEAVRAIRDLRAILQDIREAWRWALETGDAVTLADTVEELATFYDFLGLLAEGEQLLQRAAVLARRTKEQPFLLGRARYWLASFQFRLGRTQEAFDGAKRVAADAELAGDMHLRASAHALEAEVLAGRAEYTEAKRLMRSSLDLYSRGPRDRRLADALFRLATIEWHSGDLHGALASYEQAEKLFAELGDVEGRARALSYVAGIHWELASARRAEELLRQAEELYASLGHTMGIAGCRARFAIISHQDGRYEEAIAAVDEAAERYREIGDEAGYANAVGNRAGMLLDLGRFEEAQASARQALDIAVRVGNERNVARHTFNIGQAQMGLGDDDGANEHFGRALQILRAMAPNRLTLVPLLGSAEIYLRRGLGSDALALAEEALDVARQIGHKGYVVEAEVMRFRALAATGDRDTALAGLGAMAATGSDDEAIGRASYATWALTGEEAAAKVALEHYRALHTRTPTHYVKERLRELTAVIGNQP